MKPLPAFLIGLTPTGKNWKFNMEPQRLAFQPNTQSSKDDSCCCTPAEIMRKTINNVERFSDEQLATILIHLEANLRQRRRKAMS